MQEDDPRITVSMDMKINLGNYESASVGIILSRLPAGATNEQIEELLDTGRLAWDMLKARLKDEVTETRQRHGL